MLCFFLPEGENAKKNYITILPHMSQCVVLKTRKCLFATTVSSDSAVFVATESTDSAVFIATVSTNSAIFLATIPVCPCIFAEVI